MIYDNKFKIIKNIFNFLLMKKKNIEDLYNDDDEVIDQVCLRYPKSKSSS